MGLDLVEGRNLRVQSLELLVVKGRRGEGLEVEKRRVGRELLGQEKVLERDGQGRLSVHPSVRGEPDEVVGGERVVDGDGEGHVVLALVLVGRHVLLAQEELISDEDDLSVDVLDRDVEELRRAVEVVVPLEVGRDGQVNLEERPGERQDVSLEVELGEAVDESVDELADVSVSDLLHADELAELGGRQVEISVPGELLALGSSDELGGDTLELSKRRHGTPHPSLDHLAHLERGPRRDGPVASQADLEDGPKDSTGRLVDVDHVGQQGVALELELRDVRLEEDVGLGRGLVDTLLDGDGDPLEQLLELELLLLPNGDEPELVRKRKYSEELQHAHRGSQVLVVGRHGRVGDVVVRRDLSELGRGEDAGLAVVLDEISLLEHDGGRVDDVGTLLLERGVVVVLVVATDTVQRRLLEHSNVPGSQEERERQNL